MSPVLCLVTDRRRFGPRWEAPLLARIAAAARAGVSIVQVRERDLEAAALLQLTRRVLDAVAGTPTRVVVNDRLDVALAAHAHGVHLRGSSMAPRRVRAHVARPFLIGRSVHERAEALADGAAEGTDYLVFGTVFESASKPGRGAAGLAALSDLCAATAVPVLAIGGISAATAGAVARAGAAGVAGIGLFADPEPEAMAELVGRLGIAFQT